MDIRRIIVEAFQEALAEKDIEPQEGITDDMILLESGLDSLDFAVLVVRLESELGYDPFILMNEPVYPRTFGEFVKTYEEYKDYASET